MAWSATSAYTYTAKTAHLLIIRGAEYTLRVRNKTQNSD